MSIGFGDIKLTFNGLLTIMFIVLKLYGTISWSWWWVLCPLWIPAVLGLSILVFFICITVSIALYDSHNKRRYW